MFHQIHFVERWGRGISLILSKEPKTEFKEVGRQFIVKFKRKVQTTETVEKTVEKILTFIKENPKITQEELSQKIGLTRRGVEWNLKQLKEKKIIQRVGGRKEGRWEIIKED
jgi:ATP-dependent DNA helicase RecG